MARYGAETRLSPAQVYARAREAFGPEGRLGLERTERSPMREVYAGGGGYVIVRAWRAGPTQVELEVWQFDPEAEQFVRSLPGPGNWLQRHWGSWRRERGERGRRDGSPL
ncbi:MAG TPA: hypothetical protein VFI42_11755 [Thermomicrobiaceae bacterium]|nr:hypothetical protein [Thermomicrobiaceae bacterium]